MYVVCSDLEGVFVPEVWINVAKKTGIEELKLTTRDITDYNVLMKRRLSILEEHNMTIGDLQSVIATLDPIEGALDFIAWVKKHTQFFLVSDTFVEFADPLMEKLGRPTLFCNTLTISKEGKVIDYNLRQPDQKRQVVKALKSLNYQVVAFGDSYNDISMLKEADNGILYCPPANVCADYPELPKTFNYSELKRLIEPLICK